jgi:hypothetical protein
LIQFSVNGQKVPTVNLSDGYRSVVALAGDLIWRLLQAFPDLEDPTQAPGVVLIDELDIHLHPSWQRQIAGWLQDTFPNLQFFVATHSPLIAAGGGDAAYTIRLEMVSGEIQITPIDDLSTLDADRILRSPAFGLSSTYAPATQQKIDRYHLLRKRNGDLGSDKPEMEQLELFMQRVDPLGGSPDPDSLESRIEHYLEKALP